MSVVAVTITPALASFATPYSANDVLGAVNTISNVIDYKGGALTLGSLCIIDKAKQKKDTDIFFFDVSPTISADNAAYDLTDAFALGCLGSVSIAAADYIDSASNSVATVRGLSLLLSSVSPSKDIYCVVVTRGTPTYGSASDLVIRMAFYQES